VPVRKLTCIISLTIKKGNEPLFYVPSANSTRDATKLEQARLLHRPRKHPRGSEHFVNEMPEKAAIT
jgi:hypothetical protein